MLPDSAHCAACSPVLASEHPANPGIDITDKDFWSKGLDEVERLLNETTTLAVKMGKLKRK